jgi:hypothetical protein
MAFKRKSKNPEIMPAELHGAEAQLQQSDLVNANVGKKKGVSPALLGGGAAALAAAALGGWYLLGARQVPEEDTAAPILSQRPASSNAAASNSAPGAASNSAVAARPANAGASKGAKPAAGAKPPTGAKPGAATRIATSSTRTATRVAPAPKNPNAAAGGPSGSRGPRPGSVAQVKQAAATRPGRLGQVPTGVDGNAPILAPERPGAPPSAVPVVGAPTPIGPPDGMEGMPGRRGGRDEIVLSQVPGASYASRPTSAGPLRPALKARLKELWNQGAAAKSRGDNAAARRAWTQILRLRPGHPGIREAIAKLR